MGNGIAGIWALVGLAVLFSGYKWGWLKRPTRAFKFNRQTVLAGGAGEAPKGIEITGCVFRNKRIEELGIEITGCVVRNKRSTECLD